MYINDLKVNNFDCFSFHFIIVRRNLSCRLKLRQLKFSEYFATVILKNICRQRFFVVKTDLEFARKARNCVVKGNPITSKTSQAQKQFKLRLLIFTEKMCANWVKNRFRGRLKIGVNVFADKHVSKYRVNSTEYKFECTSQILWRLNLELATIQFAGF